MQRQQKSAENMKIDLDSIPMFEFTMNSDSTIQEYHPLLQRLPLFVGSGSFGVTIGDGKHCIKISDHILGRELKFAALAASIGVGPKLLCHGFIVVPPEVAQSLKKSALAADLPVPKWLKHLMRGAHAQLAFIAFEQWTMTLYQVLLENDLTLDLIRPIIEPYRHKLKLLKRERLVHGDLMPRNILVKIVDGKLTDLCFTDFADAFRRKNWFTGERISQRFRDVTLRVFNNYTMNAKLKVALHQSAMTDQESLRQWMLFEPHNLDACVLASLCHLFDVPDYFPVSMPPAYNFNLPWTPDCLMKVAVQHLNYKEEFTVHGLHPLSRLRHVLNEYGSQRFGKMHFLTTEGEWVPREKEAETFPSACIVADPNILFRYCIHMGAEEPLL